MGLVVNATPRPLYPREWPGTHCTGGWVGPQGRSGRVLKISPPPGFDSRTVRPARSYTDYATPAHRLVRVKLNSYFKKSNGSGADTSSERRDFYKFVLEPPM
jgi:hypothetical protein